MNNECDPALVTIIVSSTSYRKCSRERVTAPNWARCTFNSCLQCRLQLLNSSHLYSLITNKSWFTIDIITISFIFDCPMRCAMWPFGYCETLNIWVWEMFNPRTPSIVKGNKSLCLVWSKWGSQCLGFGKLFNVLQSPIGRMVSRPMRSIERFPSKQMYLWSREKKGVLS